MDPLEINTDSERSKCCFCFKSSKFISNNHKTTSEIVYDIYNSCRKFISSEYLNDDRFLHWSQQMPLPFCKKCLKWTLKLTRMNEKLEQIQKQIEDLVNSFTTEFTQSRENPKKNSVDSDIEEPSFFNASFKKDPYEESVGLDLPIKEEHEDVSDLFDENENAGLSPFHDQEPYVDDNQFTAEEIKPEIVKKETKIYQRGRRKKKLTSKAKKYTSKLKPTATVNLRRIKFDSAGKPIPDSDLLPRRRAAVKAEKTFLSRDDEIDELSESEKLRKDTSDSEASEFGSSEEENASYNKSSKKQTKSLRRKPQKGADGKFHCLQCNKSYKKRQYLRDHELTHDESKRFKCTLCNVSYAYIRNLRQHLFKHKHNLLSADCMDDQLDEKKFKCQLCDKTYTAKYRLKEHERTHDKDKRFECTVCGVSYAYIRNLRQHLLGAHSLYLKCENKVMSVTTERPSTDGTKSEVDKMPRSLDCKVCGKVCKSTGQLYYHRATTHKARPRTCDVCQKEFKNAETLKSHKRKAHAPMQKFECTICTKQFKTSTGLKEHIMRHNRDPNDKKALEQFVCPKCGKSLSSRGSLNLHILRHSEVKRFECPMKCGKRFSTKSNMNDHVIYHKGERPFLCEECGKGFFTKAKLNNHTRIHTGLLHFCEYCGKGFQTTTHLKQHHRSHNKPPKESPAPSASAQNEQEQPIDLKYTCAICVQCFDSEATLADHMRMHDDFSGLLRFTNDLSTI